MTEQEWYDCNSVTAMLEQLRRWERCDRNAVLWTEENAGMCPHCRSTMVSIDTGAWQHPHYIVTDRKLRLFAAACCRMVWSYLADEGRRTVEAMEDVADGRTNVDALQRYHVEMAGSLRHLTVGSMNWAAGYMAERLCRHGGPNNGLRVAVDVVTAIDTAISHLYCTGLLGDIDFAALLREVLNSPYCTDVIYEIPPLRDGGWLLNRQGNYYVLPCQYHPDYDGTYNPENMPSHRVFNSATGMEDPCKHCLRVFGKTPSYPERVAMARPPDYVTPLVISAARAAYDTHDFTELPIIADYLDEAGCPRHDILEHLRLDPTSHVRGCWALDAILGKS